MAYPWHIILTFTDTLYFSNANICSPRVMTNPVLSFTVKNKAPVVRVLATDGSVAEFKEAVLVIPEVVHDGGNRRLVFNEGSQVFYVAVNRDGVPFASKDGAIPLFECPPFVVELSVNDYITPNAIAQIAGVSLSTVKRAMASGNLKGKVEIGKRRVAFPRSAVEAWIALRSREL